MGIGKVSQGQNRELEYRYLCPIPWAKASHMATPNTKRPREFTLPPGAKSGHGGGQDEEPGPAINALSSTHGVCFSPGQAL